MLLNSYASKLSYGQQCGCSKQNSKKQKQNLKIKNTIKQNKTA